MIRRYNLVYDLLFGLIAMWIFIFLYFGYLEWGLILKGGRGCFFAVNELDEGDVFGKLGNLVVLEVNDDFVLRAGKAELAVFLDDEGVKAAMAEGVAAGSQQSRHVVATVLVLAEWAL